MATGDLTTLATAKDWLGVASSDTSQDTRIERLITAASGRIVQFLSRGILSASYSETYDGGGNDELAINNMPITAITSLTIDGVVIPAATESDGVPPSGGYTFFSVGDPPLAIMSVVKLWGYCFCRGLGNVEIAYTAGVATVPGDIEQSCLELLQFMNGARGINTRVGSMSTPGVGSVTFSNGQSAVGKSGLPIGVEGALNPYRRVY